MDGVTTVYGYDDIDQLISETDTTGYAASYQYDANGNRTSRTVNGLVESYVYDAGDKLQSVTWSGGFKNYSYDAAGNTKTIATPSGTTTLNYDEEGRLTGIVYPSAATNAFSYNGFRARRTITDSAGTRSCLRDGQDASSNIVSNGQGFPFPGGLGERKSWTTLWHHGGLKNVDGRSTTAGALTGTKRYDAFGNEKATSGWWGAVPTVERYGGQYGYQADSESGLMMLGNRYLDASLGRFVSRDPVKASNNWYSYCRSNPVSRIDPSGLDDSAPWIGYGMALRISQMPPWLQRIVLNVMGWSFDRLQTALNNANRFVTGAAEFGDDAANGLKMGVPSNYAQNVAGSDANIWLSTTNKFPEIATRNSAGVRVVGEKIQSIAVYNDFGRIAFRIDFWSRKGRRDFPFPHTQWPNLTAPGPMWPGNKVPGVPQNLPSDVIRFHREARMR